MSSYFKHRLSRLVSILLCTIYPSVVLAQDATVSRIIALSPHSVEMLFLLGVGDKIVGTTEFADYPEAAKSIPRIGGHMGVQLDRVLELSPDLVIIWESGNQTKDIERIASFGIPIYISQTKRLEDIPKELQTLGKRVGRTARGEELAHQYVTRLEALRARYRGASPVRFFYQLWTTPLRTIGGGSWINQMFEGCGGRNIFYGADMDYPLVSLESVIEKQPEVIVVPSPEGREIPADLWQSWPEIPAVEKQQIMFFEADLLHRFSYRARDGMQAVCERFEQIRNATE